MGVTARSAVAQIAAAEITGQIVDQAGAPAPGVTVTATDVHTNQTRVAITTATGSYTLSGLAPGEYRLDASLQGFKPIHRDSIPVATGEKTRVDFELAIGH